MSRYRKFTAAIILLGTSAIFCAAASVVYFQEHLLFPYYDETQRRPESERTESASGGISRVVLDPGENQIEVWHAPASGTSRGVAVIFRANMGTLSDHTSLIDLAVGQGLDAAIFNYPGMGMSSGSLSEKTILSAGERVIQHFYTSLQDKAKKLWIFGYSIGTGPAGALALKYKPEVLVLFAPYTSITEVIKTRTRYGALAGFSRFDFELKKPISLLEKTHLLVVTGGADTTIFPEMSLRVLSAYRGQGRSHHIHNPAAPHDHLVGANRLELDRVLGEIVSGEMRSTDIPPPSPISAAEQIGIR